ncbi:hypothetical protein F7P75_10145 [Acinetobacter gandensis]|uniref:Uncharacterized protein n=1 Tax=Acinetobacter gandensis TaxID=1443941 RepID=A0A1A7R909_9GAMM|nr:hypothetical protein F7P75_10145 [Acinetobacter gandensis]OBX27973.1 hypothetical protein A9J31_07570 [Acinetobacter gandensis]
MNVIFIHGMNQQQQTAASLQQHWLDILEQGLIQAHQQAAFPYFKKMLTCLFMETYSRAII